jgi:hypothetical protein
MQMIFDLLTYRKLLREDAQAIELFGMFGLWHTKYYVDYVAHVDIFETNTIYHNLSKFALGSAKVSYFNADSLVYASQTDKRYEIVVADTPMGASFYDRSGLPVFWNSLLRIATPQAVVIVNVPTWVLAYEEEFMRALAENTPVRKIKDVFFVPRDNVVSYCVVVIHDPRD